MNVPPFNQFSSVRWTTKVHWVFVMNNATKLLFEALCAGGGLFS